MQKVLEIINQGVLLIGLFYLACIDWKTKLIHESTLWLLAGIGFVIKIGFLFFLQKEGILEWKIIAEEGLKVLLSMLVGVVLLWIAMFTKEQVGFGDAYLFCVTGIFLDDMQNVILLLGSLFLTGMFCMGSLFLKKKGKHDSVAMVPFVLTAYVLFIL